MQRDLDLARQLLLEIEARGADCSVSVLRPDRTHESEEAILYHLRLLIDGGYLKEVDRTSAGIPCVRLTHEGHELLALVRQDSLWREAKYLCQERLGAPNGSTGLSLTAIRVFLLRLVVGPSGWLPRRPQLTARRIRRYRPAPYELEAVPYFDRFERTLPLESDEVRYVRVPPAAAPLAERISSRREQFAEDARHAWDDDFAFPSNLI